MNLPTVYGESCCENCGAHLGITCKCKNPSSQFIMDFDVFMYILNSVLRYINSILRNNIEYIEIRRSDCLERLYLDNREFNKWLKKVEKNLYLFNISNLEKIENTIKKYNQVY